MMMRSMQALSPPNIESELSYAYLHAVAAKAGMACSATSRHEDNQGVDAHLTAWGPFPDGGYLQEVAINVQLKATTTIPAEVHDGADLSFFIRETRRYDDLRMEAVSVPRLLVVLFLPAEAGEWLNHSADQLALRRCAYWQSLRGAPGTSNESGATVYLPKAQMFSPEALHRLAARLSRRDFPTYPAA